MGESDRTPQIQFEIDQEIFVDSVEEGVVIEDAAVATEITMFERIGDAYVLEGAIVFAGYTRPPGGAPAEPVDGGVDALSLEDEVQQVNHFHHRLPFVLRVPARAQPKGIVNVNSRISSWRLEVVSPGWIRILGDLTLLGLNSSEGYHFECGPQEEGDLLFQSAWNTTQEYVREVHEVEDAAEEHRQEENLKSEVETPQAQESQTQEWGKPDFPSGVESSEVKSTEFQEAYELVQGSRHRQEFRNAFDSDAPSASSIAGGGSQDAVAGNGETGDTDNPETEAKKADNPEIMTRGEATVADQKTENFTSEGLQRLDRLFGKGEKQTPSDSQAVPAETGSPSDGGESRKPTSESKVIEFDFEHQVDIGSMPASDTSGVLEGNAGHRQETAPEIILGEHSEHVQAETRGNQEDPGQTAQNMWSFVDFDTPDARYTMRYVIATEEESLDELALRLNCSREEIMKMNQLPADVRIHPGQPLVVPNQAEE